MWHWSDVRFRLHGRWLQTIGWLKPARMMWSGLHGVVSSALLAHSLR